MVSEKPISCFFDVSLFHFLKKNNGILAWGREREREARKEREGGEEERETGGRERRRERGRELRRTRPPPPEN